MGSVVYGCREAYDPPYWNWTLEKRQNDIDNANVWIGCVPGSAYRNGKGDYAFYITVFRQFWKNKNTKSKNMLLKLY